MSPFAKTLKDFLTTYVEDELSAEELILLVSKKVSQNHRQSPIGGPLNGCGDLGGMFILEKK